MKIKNSKNLLTGLMLLFFALFPLEADKVVFYGGRMSYSTREGQQKLIIDQNGFIDAEDYTIRAVKIEVTGKDFDIINAMGDVVVTDKKKGSIIKSEEFTYDRTIKRIEVKGQIFYHDKKNDLQIRCNYLVQNDADNYNMSGAIRLLKENLFARADNAIYNDTTQVLRLIGAAEAYRKNDEFKADQMIINTKTDTVQMIGSISGTIENTKENNNEGN